MLCIVDEFNLLDGIRKSFTRSLVDPSRYLTPEGMKRLLEDCARLNELRTESVFYPVEKFSLQEAPRAEVRRK